MANWSVSIKIKVHLIQNRPTLIDLRFGFFFHSIAYCERLLTGAIQCENGKYQIISHVIATDLLQFTFFVGWCIHSMTLYFIIALESIGDGREKKLARAIRLNAHSGSNYSFWEFKTIDSPKAAHSFSIQKKDLINRKK